MWRSGSDEGPGHFAFGHQGKVEQQLLAMVARQDLEADRQTVQLAGGKAHGGAAVRFEGAVRAALFMMARAKPTSWIRFAARES